jgi:tetratricopeptide (TPR) repeat protein
MPDMFSIWGRVGATLSNPSDLCKHTGAGLVCPVGWEEEGWYAEYQCGRQLEALGRRAEAIESYLKAYQRRSHRAEPLCDLARMHRESQHYHVAHLFASRAIAVSMPDDTLFLDSSVYEWRALDEYAVACYWLGDYAECAKVSERLLNGGLLPDIQRERVAKNRDLALAQLRNSGAFGAVVSER